MQPEPHEMSHELVLLKSAGQGEWKIRLSSGGGIPGLLNTPTLRVLYAPCGADCLLRNCILHSLSYSSQPPNCADQRGS